MFEHTSSPTRGRITGRILTGILAVALAGYTLPPATAADSPPPPTAPAAVATVNAPATPTMLAPVRTMTSTVYFATSSARVTPASRTALTRFVRSLPKAAVVVGVQVRGYVQGSPTTRNNKVLSHARAGNVAAWLKALHLAGPYTLTSGGVAGNTLRARRAVVTVTYRLRAAQTITFTQPESLTVGDANLPLTATSSTGLLVTLTSLTPAVCTVVARAAHAVSAGTCTLRATQAGNGYVLPALAVTRTFTIAPAQFTVTYNANGGVVDPPSAVYTSGQAGLNLPDPTQTNFIFAGWFTTAVAGTQVHTPYVPTAATTLYAHWIATHSVVTYNLNYGGAADPTTANFTYPTPLSLPSFARDHYTFAGWYDAPSGGTIVGGATDPYSPTSDTTLWAHWTGITYTVTYVATDGSVTPSSDSYVTGDTGLTLAIPTRAHYNFAGWFDGAVDGNAISSPYAPTSDITIYARWTGVDYTVTFNTAGGEPLSSAVYTYGDAGLTLPEPTKADNTFDGWYTAINDGVGVDSPYTTSVNVTLYAHWNPAQ